MKRFTVAFVVCCLGLYLQAQDKYEMVVAQDGSGDYTTIQAAIDASKAFPDTRVIIHIRNGIYHEKVHVPSCNTKLSLIGESRDNTIISFNDYFNKINRGRNSTFYTYTLLVEADDFRAENLTIENTAGPVGQAVALHVEGNRCVIFNCNILGNQDTLYVTGENSSQYYRNCYIEGTTDFIFGSATALFQDCAIRSKADSYITAASTPKGKEYGFVFMNCKITAAEGVSKVYLGRPWRDFAKVVFMNCELGAHILTEGWSNWDKTNRDKTAYFAEFKNNGPGFTPQKRVAWSHQLTPKEASKYTLSKILNSTMAIQPAEEWTGQ